MPKSSSAARYAAPATATNRMPKVYPAVRGSCSDAPDDGVAREVQVFAQYGGIVGAVGQHFVEQTRLFGNSKIALEAVGTDVPRRLGLCTNSSRVKRVP